MLGLQRPEKRLLRTKNLDRTRRVLGQTQQTAGMADQSRSDELTDEGGKVGCDGGHAVFEVLCELRAVLGYRDDLVAELVDVGDVGVGDFGSH